MSEALYDSAKEARRRAYYALRPAEWCRDYLGIPVWNWIWSQAGQANPAVVEAVHGGVDPYEAHEWAGMKDPLFQAMMALARGERRVAIASGTGVSKSFTAGCMALWYLDTHRMSRWAAFAPKKDQVKKDGFFAEVDKLISEFEGPKGSFRDLHPNCDFNGDGFYIDREAYGTRWYAFVRAATVREGEQSSAVTQGLHHPNLVAYIEEFPGVKPAIRAAIIRTLSDESNQLFVVGNPEMKGDPLDELVHHPRSFGVKASPKDFPNIVLRKQLIPGATSWQQFLDLRYDAAKNLGIDFARLEDGHPDPATDDELAHDPHYKIAVLGLWPSVRTDTFVPANRITAADDHLVRPHEAVYHTEFTPTAGLPLEGTLTVYARPAWEGDDGALKEEKVWRDRYVVYMDTAKSYEVTPTNSGDRNKNDWHTAVVFDTVEESVVALARTRGLIYLHTLAALWLCDRFTLRYPKNGKEQAGPPSAWTGLARPVFGWERNAEGGIPNMTFPTGEDARTLGIIPPEALDLPDGRTGWPWKSTRQYGRLYRPLSDSKDPALASLFGIQVTGSNRGDLLDRLANWATRITAQPWIVRSPEIHAELGTFVEKRDASGKVRVEHADGKHDDGLFAVMGCLQIAHHLRSIGLGPKASKWPEAVSKADTERAKRRKRAAPKPAFGAKFRSAFRG